MHRSFIRRPFVAIALLPALGACASQAPPQAVAVPVGAAVPAVVEAPIDPIERAFEAVRSDSAALLPFLRAMPKGGDLHSHLSGAVYAESFLRWAAEDGLCVDVEQLTLLQPEPACDQAEGRPAVHDALSNVAIRDRLVDAFSMRHYAPAVENGHDRFFATFSRFSAAQGGRTGDMFAEVQARAAAGGVSYLELMSTLKGSSVRGLGALLEWDDDFDVMRHDLLDAGLRDTASVASRALAGDLSRAGELLACDSRAAAPGCDVTARVIYQVLRAFPREQVFAMILMGFEMVQADPNVVSLNLVQPEDHPVAMGDYSLHMRMIGHLSRLYPDVPVTLHAGELWDGLVPPEGLRFHIREAVEVAGARRIGHGVDVLHENDAEGLLRTMAERSILVEINLTSNDVILGVRGASHPLHTYLEYGVPVALSTDDEGVSRSEMTQEFMKAVQDQHIDYATLKRMVRNSLEYAFVEGAGLWEDLDAELAVAVCREEVGGLDGSACAAFLADNAKARLQAELERDLMEFEAGWGR